MNHLLTPRQRDQLNDKGYILLENRIDGDFLHALTQRIEQLFEEEGENAGAEFKQEPGARRLANLVNKGEIFQRAIAFPPVLECVRAVLGPAFKLSSLNARSVNPRGGITQPLHADMAAVPDENGYWVSNALWMLDDFTPDNGPLRVVPGTHRAGRLPQDALADPAAPHPEEILLTGPAGTVAVINAHLWHAGCANRTEAPRRALHAFYCRADKPQQQYQKQLLDPQVQAALSPALRKLLALDDPENDRLARCNLPRSGFLK